VPWRITNASKA
jgi:hypothetical protein